MKARIKKTNEVVEVKKITNTVYKSENAPVGNKYYCISELELPIKDFTASEKIENSVEANGFRCLINNNSEYCCVYLGNRTNNVHSIISKSKKDNYAVISDLFVKEQYRFNGIGRKTIELCEKIAKIMSANFIRVKVKGVSKMIFSKLGYIEYSIENDYTYMVKQIKDENN